MKKLEKAIEFATSAHLGQTRSDGSEYIQHPIRVMNLVREQGVEDENTLCAAVLHDVLEDTNITRDIMEREFGKEVTDIVVQLTNAHPPRTPFAVKQAALLEHARHMDEPAKQIKVADRHDNISDCSAWELFRRKRYANAALDLLNALEPIPSNFVKLANIVREKSEKILQED